MLIFPSAVWQCNVVYLADKLIFFGGNEWGGEWGVLPQPVADSRMFNKCVTFLCGGMEAIGERRLANGRGAYYGAWGDAMCAYPPGRPLPVSPPFFPERLWSASTVCSLHTRLELIFMLWLYFRKGWSPIPDPRSGRLWIYVFMYEVYMGQPASTHSAAVCSATMKCRPRVENTLEKI